MTFIMSYNNIPFILLDIVKYISTFLDDKSCLSLALTSRPIYQKIWSQDLASCYLYVKPSSLDDEIAKRLRLFDNERGVIFKQKIHEFAQLLMESFREMNPELLQKLDLEYTFGKEFMINSMSMGFSIFGDFWFFADWSSNNATRTATFSKTEDAVKKLLEEALK